jgi:hypothetical protein
MGSDTMEALLAARRYYGAEMPGFSIPAAEHSTMTSWGREREATAYEHMLDSFDGDGAIVAVVSDSYDLDAAVRGIWGGTLRDKVLARKGTLVVRPDSGDPMWPRPPPPIPPRAARRGGRRWCARRDGWLPAGSRSSVPAMICWYRSGATANCWCITILPRSGRGPIAALDRR